MSSAPHLSEIFSITTDDLFISTVFRVYRYQYENNLLYKNFSDSLNKNPSTVSKIEEIPFLPIDFFKTQKIFFEEKEPELVFSSSGTTETTKSFHYIKDASVYENSFSKSFHLFYGNPQEYCILALLPSYLERDGSSLVYMTNSLIKKSGHSLSGFYLDDFTGLAETLKFLESKNQKTLLLGVSFALLDFAQKFPLQLNNTIVMETGGMKGRREEVTREELHKVLCSSFHLKQIHSEYGMTELLSQAYSSGKGIFKSPPWMRIIIRETNDPLNLGLINKTGGINVIDLANLYSCSFIATQDLGKVLNSSEFEVLGRFDHSNIRGCNLLMN